MTGPTDSTDPDAPGGSDRRSTAAPGDAGDAAEDDSFAESRFLTYVIPFAGSLLIAVGIGAGVVGGYAPLQQELGLCGAPTVTVHTAAETVELTDDETLELPELAFEELTPAEQAAVEEARSDPQREGAVRGEFAHREAFESGVLIRQDGETRYATLTSNNRCASVDPLLFPLGVAAILLGVVWILAPPMYRRLAAVEQGA
ncbi:hypothetical protein [Halosimplex salinum]|uniref:hypothetical protein n=1 Tax=Halosimplex salinum TaxID=1710538 RepID=UPI0019D2274C|nr:hypothetical protein [Halosimplex salinum]